MKKLLLSLALLGVVGAGVVLAGDEAPVKAKKSCRTCCVKKEKPVKEKKNSCCSPFKCGEKKEKVKTEKKEKDSCCSIFKCCGEKKEKVKKENKCNNWVRCDGKTMEEKSCCIEKSSCRPSCCEKKEKPKKEKKEEKSRRTCKTDKTAEPVL